MIYIEALMVATMMMAGIYSSISDIRKSIVPNKILILASSIGIVLHILYFAIGTGDYYPTWLLNMIIADALSVLMYLNKMWAAGDSKLFVVMYFLFPPRLLDANTFEHSIVPYILIFVPAIIWIIIDTIYRYIKHEKHYFKKVATKDLIKNILYIYIEATAFYRLFAMLWLSFIQNNELFCSAIILVYAVICSNCAVFRKWYAVCVHGIIIIISWIINNTAFSLPDAKTALIILGVIGFQEIISVFNYQCIPTNSVRKGMIIASRTAITFQKSKVHDLPVTLDESLASKITEEQAAAVKRWEKSVSGEHEIWIVRKVPFAIIIFLGFFIWLVIKMVG